MVASKIYLLGGHAKAASTAEARYSALVDVFDTSKGKFSAGVPMTAGRIGHSAASYAGVIYVFGGRSVTGVMLPLVEAFDTSSGKWVKKTPMPAASKPYITSPGKVWRLTFTNLLYNTAPPFF